MAQNSVAEEPAQEAPQPTKDADATAIEVAAPLVADAPEEKVQEVTVEGLENGTAKYQIASRMLMLLTERKSWFLYIGTFAFFFFNLKGKENVFTAEHLLGVFGIVSGTAAAQALIKVFKK